MGDSGVASLVRDPLASNGSQRMTVDGHEECDCERRCSNPKHCHDCKSGDYTVSPVLERRNKGVFGRLRNLASRTSYSTSEDGHSHSSDYEDQDDEKKPESGFRRDSRERTSTSSWAGRVRDLHRDVKKKISRLRNSKAVNQDEDIGECHEGADDLIHNGSSVESIPSGSGSSLQAPTPTSSNRSSTSAGEEEHSAFVGTFISRARALVDCTPSPYDKDGLAFKKGDIVDIIAKHKTGIWVGMAQGKIGHFKFINVEEIEEERKIKHRRRKVKSEWIKQPQTIEELLKQIDLEEYTNVLILNGYDELDTFKEIEKVDLDGLGITNPDHCSKLLKAVEMLQDTEPDTIELEEDESKLKQSPRDSGCYASHENLIQQDSINNLIQQDSLNNLIQQDSINNLIQQNSSQDVLNNRQFIVDLEDLDTSQSESCIQSKVGQDSILAMNNLDVGHEQSSTKSTATTDDVRTTDTNGCIEMVADHNTYNILASAETVTSNLNGDRPEVSCDTVEVTTCNTLASAETVTSNLNGDRPEVSRDTVKSEQDSNSLNVPYFLSHAGTKSSPGSPRKVRSKHHRNKSHSHRCKDLLNDYSIYGFSKYRDVTPDCLPDRVGYVYGWATFSTTDKSCKKNLHEYDDVVSDPAAEVEDSPGRHVYRKVKQRKGSLQTLIYETKPSSPTLMSKVSKKLAVEKIYLHEEPYTDKTGFCGIPPALVQRYAEELHHSIVEVADALDQIRITSLQQQGRRGVPNDFLSDSCIIPVIEPKYSNLQAWLISLGLPMYIPNFLSANVEELYDVAELSMESLAHMGIKDPLHQMYLESAIGSLFMRFRRKPQTYTEGQSIA